MVHPTAWLRHVALGALLVVPMTAGAQTATDPHHPAQGAGATPGAAPSSGGAAGMGGSPMMANMMQMMMPMMQGHATGMMGSGEGDLTRLFSTERIAGRLAYLRAEIAITDAQASTWNGFVEIVRAQAKRLSDARAHMAGIATASTSIVDRLEHEEHLVALRLDALRALKPALAALHASLSDDQKKTAEQLLPPPRAMMPMGMMQGGGMPMPRPANR